MKTEKIEFDELERISLKKEVFLKLPLLRKYVYSEDNFKMLITYLNDIHQQPTERIMDAISYTNEVLVRQFGQRITQEAEKLFYSSLLWEWIYLLAYYRHRIDLDPLWIENFLPHMKQFQIRPAAKNEMEQGEKLINQYIDVRLQVLETQRKMNEIIAETHSEQDMSTEAKYLARIAELEQQLAECQKATATDGPTEKQLEETFTYPFRQKQSYSQMLDCLIKEAKKTTDIQWARHALAIFENRPSVLINPPADFKSWLEKFCKLFGRKWVRNYEPQKLKKIKGKRAKPSEVTIYLPIN